MKTRFTALSLVIFICFSLCLSGCTTDSIQSGVPSLPQEQTTAYTILKQNQPDFAAADLKPQSFEQYSPLDALGRCGPAFACVGTEIMPTEERGSIGQIKPSGWHTVKYEHIDGKYLYNRCHLIGYQLTGENANPQNLITGTRYLNTEGMLPFENQIADFVKTTGYHVLYRATPVFEGENLLASGVILEAQSIEDNGQGIQFHVYCYNKQPGVTIDYATGESHLETFNTDSNPAIVDSSSLTSGSQHYILNTNSHKFHTADCSQANSIKAKNRKDYTGNREDLLQQGYLPCKSCNP